MSGVKIGVSARFKNPAAYKQPWPDVYRDYLDYARRADELGFDGVWVPEHHCVESGYNPAPFVALAALAMVTKNCNIGTAPLLLPLYNPVLVAESAAVIDVLSNGRMILGIAVGYLESDFEVIGVPRKERGARLDEALQILMKALWQDESFDFEGRFFNHKGVKLSPPPVQKKMEIQISARSEAAAKRVGFEGININLNSSTIVETVGPLVAEVAAKAGRNPADVGVGMIRTAFLAGTEDAARQAVKQYVEEDAKEYIAFTERSSDAVDAVYGERFKQVGAESKPMGDFSAQQLIDGIGQDIEITRKAGLRPDWINLSAWPPGMPLAQALDNLERIAAEVLPKIERRMGS